MLPMSARTGVFSIGTLRLSPKARHNDAGAAHPLAQMSHAGAERLRNRAGSLHDPQTTTQEGGRPIMQKITRLAIAALATTALQGAALANEADNVIHNRYDGVTNDLLTAG